MQSKRGEYILSLLKQASFDHASILELSFKDQRIFEKHFFKGEEQDRASYFDLASLTKAIVLGTNFLLHPEHFVGAIRLLSEHRGGLKSGGRLHKDSWRDLILSYEVKESPTLYSDYSAIRCQLELEKKIGLPLKQLIEPYLNAEIYYHTDRFENAAPTGFSQGKVIRGKVHDPNAYNLHVFLAHAGFFATAKGLADFLFKINRDLGLIKRMKSVYHDKVDRFLYGWDTPSGENSLAGKVFGPNTIGHLGFTGTSMWVDLEQEKGMILLTNATQHYWHDRGLLNELRRTVGHDWFMAKN
jgi:hypothetical protein